MMRLCPVPLFACILFCLPTFTPLINAGPEPADLNGDGMVDNLDLFEFFQQWGRHIDDSTPTASHIIDIPGLAQGARPMKLIRIPAGEFQMGAPESERGRVSDQGPVHTVMITNDFYIGETEVTQAQWQAIMGNNPAIGNEVGEDRPAVRISWNNITGEDGFLDRLNELGEGIFRLPTEAEWEYACRAGTQTRFSFGDNLDCEDTCTACPLADEHMWWCPNNTPSGSKEVGGKLPNGFGLYDMHGNVWEWCQDAYLADFYSQPEATQPDPVSDSTESVPRVIRGGGWFDATVNCRSAKRERFLPATSVSDLGVRVVLVVSR